VVAEEAVEDLTIAKARQRSLQDKRLQATEEVNEQLACSRERVRRLQNFVLAAWGPKDTRLEAFGVKPASGPREAKRKGGSPGYTH
jgi:hypothetical protein